jgi:hypothetical protein
MASLSGDVNLWNREARLKVKNDSIRDTKYAQESAE